MYRNRTCTTSSIRLSCTNKDFSLPPSFSFLRQCYYWQGSSEAMETRHLPSWETLVVPILSVLSAAELAKEDSFLESLPMGRNPLPTLFIPAMPHHKVRPACRALSSCRLVVLGAKKTRPRNPAGFRGVVVRLFFVFCDWAQIGPHNVCGSTISFPHFPQAARQQRARSPRLLTKIATATL